MQEPTAIGARADGRIARWVFVCSTALFIGDRVLKSAALSHDWQASGAAVSLVLFRNTGIAFSIPVPDPVFWPFACTALAMLAWTFWGAARDRRMRQAGLLFCILLGALSNFFDRAAHGAVIDYFLFFGRSAVNIADGMIVGGLAAVWWYAQDEERRS